MVAQSGGNPFFEPVTAQQLSIIHQELNEYEGKTDHILKLLEQWMDCQPNFPKSIDKKFVRGLIKMSKHNLDKSKRKLENYVAVKGRYPQIFDRRSPKDPGIQKIQNIVSLGFVPKITENGSRVITYSLRDTNVEDFDVNQILKHLLMTLDLWQSLDIEFCGEIVIFDCQGITSAHIPKLLVAFKIAVDILKEAYTIRLKQVHLLNLFPAIETIINTIKPLLNKKIRDNIFVHKDLNSLQKEIPKENLPKNYGGTAISTEEAALKLKEQLNLHAHWFQEQESVKFMGKNPMSINIEDLGSFRKLNID